MYHIENGKRKTQKVNHISTHMDSPRFLLLYRHPFLDRFHFLLFILISFHILFYMWVYRFYVPDGENKKKKSENPSHFISRRFSTTFYRNTHACFGMDFIFSFSYSYHFLCARMWVLCIREWTEETKNEYSVLF